MRIHSFGLRANRSAESGQGMLEYVLIVVFVAVAGIVVWRTLGGEIRGLVDKSGTAVSEQSGKVLDVYDKEKNKK